MEELKTKECITFNTHEDYKKFYDSDERFKRYVDRYKNEFNLTLDEALSHFLVKETAQYYVDSDKDKIKEMTEELVIGCGCAEVPEDRSC